MGDARTAVDVDEVSGVVAFYQRAADVVGSAARDLQAHEFGDWAIGPDYHDMGERYRDMGRMLADRLAEQADAADRLAAALHHAMTSLIRTDEIAEASIRSAGAEEAGSR
ncbi:hypothetical protein V1Y59_04685 [Gordonia sp. PKS22-38]|uniref:Excreted virulence factor EspC, type VII ESX diderm n=1 Tax=Gordonia prachuapensis TaxID=3115651 RepID=A0ABU7MPW2_9ACTN|nr:hypothetical protein [Gordonia sp. PKS22-38]